MTVSPLAPDAYENDMSVKINCLLYNIINLKTIGVEWRIFMFITLGTNGFNLFTDLHSIKKLQGPLIEMLNRKRERS